MIILTEPRMERIRRFLQSQLIDGVMNSSGRRAKMEQFKSYARRYEAKRVPKAKSFPWRMGSSQLHIGFAAIGVDSISARIINAIKASPDHMINSLALVDTPIPGVINPKTGKPALWREIAELLETYMLFEVGPNGQVNINRNIDSSAFLSCLYGTTIDKFVFETVYEREHAQDGTYYDLPVFSNCRYINIPIEDFYFPEGYSDIHRIPFVTHGYIQRPSELIQKATYGVNKWNMKTVRRFLLGEQASSEDFSKVEGDDFSELQMEQQLIERASTSGKYVASEKWVGETWARIDLDGDGRETKLLIDHALDDPTHIFRVIPWPYTQVPFIVTPYIRRENRIYGMGVVERCEHVDEGIATTFNQMVDAVTASNAKIWKVRTGAAAVSAQQNLFPGGVIVLDDPDSDLKPEQLGEVYPSIFENINLFQSYGERLIKLNDYSLGRESQANAGGGTATTTLALLNETNQYFDSITRNQRDGKEESFGLWLEYLAIYKPIERIRQVLGSDNADLLIAALSALSPAQLKKRLSIRIAFSTTAASRELARQEETAKLQILGQYYEKMLGMIDQRTQAMMMQDLGKVMYIDAVGIALEREMYHLLETFGEPYVSIEIASWENNVMKGAQFDPANPTNQTSEGPDQGPGPGDQQGGFPPQAPPQPGMGRDQGGGPPANPSRL